MPGTQSTRRDLAYQALKRRIVDNDLPPGHRLVERDLAVELGVSRIPLREALRLLSAEGLVVIVPGKGTIVAPLTPQDVRDLFDVRESLEVLAARLAAERADPAALARLRECLAAARRADGRARLLTEANADFHSALVTAADNRLLAGMMRPLEAQVRRLFHLTIDRDLDRQCAEHEALYEAIANGDAQRAAELALSHVSSGREATLAAAREAMPAKADPVSLTRSRRRTRADSPQ